MRLKPLLLLCGATQFTLTGLPLYANESDLLEMDLESLLQVTITGSTLRQESLQTVPASVSVFTRAQLDLLGLDYLHELMGLVRGFQTIRGADSPFSYAFSVRGRRQSGQSREVLVLVDGRIFTDPRTGGVESAFHLYPLANIEKIEFIRGPASAIYGSGAFTGVINIVSPKQTNNLKLGVGENQKRAADLQLAGERGDWQTNLYARLAEDDGEQYHIGSETTQDPHREALVDWNIHYRNSQLQVFYSEQKAEDFYMLEKINDDVNSYWQRYHNVRFNQTLSPTNVWKMNLALSHEYTEQELNGMLQPAGALLAISEPASAQPLLTRGELASEAYRINLANDVDVSAISSMQFGLEWQHQREIRARSYNNYNLMEWANRDYPVTYYGNLDTAEQVGEEGSRDVWGAYAQWLYQLGDATRLTAGLRYDDYQSQDSRLSPRVGLVHQLTAHHSVKFIYSEAFRAPTFAELAVLNNPVVVGNPDLTSEVIKASEILWAGIWDDLTLEASICAGRWLEWRSAQSRPRSKLDLAMGVVMWFFLIETKSKTTYVEIKTPARGWRCMRI